MAHSTLSYPAANSTPAPAGAPATPVPPPSGVRLRGGYSRARATIERRTPVLCSEPAAPGERAHGELPSVLAIEPFDPSPEHVPARTRAVVPCAACTDHGAHQPNPACQACAGSGHVATWVRILVEREQRVLVSGEGEARDRHEGVLDAADFEATTWPNLLLHQAWLRGVPPHLAPALRPVLAPNERAVWILVQTFVG